MLEPWRIKLLGWLRASRADTEITRFPTRKAAALLAALAYWMDRPHSREVLTEMLWPEADPDAARNSFRVALSSLRHLLEPPGTPAGSVLVAGRNDVQLNPANIVTDVAEFEAALDHAATCPPLEREDCLARAVKVYSGDLLPGFYEEWVTTERERLSAAFVEAACELARVREELGNIQGAIEAVRQAVAADPYRERAHQHLMTLHLAAGNPAEALYHYRTLRRILRKELRQPPSPATRAIAESIRTRLREARPPQPAGTDGEPPSGAEAPRRAPPPRMAPSGSHLPLVLTRFFGREEECARLLDTLCDDGTRLVTLTGPGGSGKTRLAIEMAGRLQSAFTGGTWFASLAEIEDHRRLLDVVFGALGLRHVAPSGPLDQIASALGHRPALLVLDNFEHIAAAGAPVVRRMLEEIPTLKCLVTSQVRLHIAGERELPISPLEMPNGAVSLEEINDLASVRLFVDRAQAVRPEFRLTERNAEAVAAVCRRLEGLPLAIELAAAWAHALTPQQMLERLDCRFDLLVSPTEGETPRHRALRTAMDWGYQLLPEPARLFLTRLSVFRNGWTLEAAQDVCEEPDALALIATLRERSFLLARDRGPEMHFAMLETIHEYAAGHLGAEERAALARRHAEYYLGFAERAQPRLLGTTMDEWLERLHGQLDNLRAALEYSLEPGGDPVVAARLASALVMFWEHRGFLQEGRRYLAGALSAITDPGERLRPLNAAARLATVLGEADQGDVCATEALAIARARADTCQEALALRNLAFVHFIRADYAKAIELQKQSIEHFRRMGDTWGMAVTLDDLGSVLTRAGDYEGARRRLEEALILHESMEHREGVGSVAFGLGVLARDLGEFAAARSYLELSLKVGREMEDALVLALSLNALGTVVALSGDVEDGRRKLDESIGLYQELRDGQGLYFAYYHMAMAVERHTDPARAGELLRRALTMAHAARDPRFTLCNLDAVGLLAADAGDMERSARILGKGDAYSREIGHPWAPYLQRERDTAILAARAKLGDAEWERLNSEGAAMALDEAVRYALGTAAA